MILENSKLVIPPGEFEAFLYDCDGTLADTMAAHIEAWVRELDSKGVRISGDLIYELAGMPATKTVEIINERYQVNLDPEGIAKAKEERFFDHYMGQIEGITEVCEHLKAMAKIGKKIAVVSGGRTRVVTKTLQILGLDHLVEVVICAEDVKHGKPHPEPFLMAAERLGVSPESCLVFEDADLGIQSAMAAGMQTVRVVGQGPR
jgi:beta-phosphoglucomutase family hydrolase